MKKLALLLAVLMVLSPAAALAQEQITLKFIPVVWPEYAENLERLIALYEAEHPGVIIECTLDGSTMTANIASGNYPNLIVDGPFQALEKYVEYLGDLTDNQVIQENVDPDSLVAATVDGRVLGVPVTTEFDGLVYNKALLREAGYENPPRTYDEMAALCAKLQEMGVTPFALGFAEAWIAAHFLIYPFAGGEDLQAVSQQVMSGEVKMSQVEFCREYQRYADLVLSNCNDKIFECDYTTMLANLAAGKAAMVPNGSWVSAMVLEMNPDFELGIMGMPYSDDAGDSKLNATPSSVISYFKDAPNADAALEFIEWLISSESGKAWLGGDFGVLTNVRGVTGDYDALVRDGMAALQRGDTKLWGDSYLKNFSYDVIFSAFQSYVLGETSWDAMWDAVGDYLVANNAA